MTMSKTEAFKSLGYEYQATRGVWTAERQGRVLVTIWQRIIRYGLSDQGPFLYVDLLELLGDGLSRIAELPSETKHHRRADRLREAWSGESELDVVVLFGPLDNSSGEAIPWNADENEGFSWHVVRVDKESGHYRLEARKNWS